MLQVIFILISRWRLDVLKPLGREEAPISFWGRPGEQGQSETGPSQLRKRRKMLWGHTGMLKPHENAFNFLSLSLLWGNWEIEGVTPPCYRSSSNCLHPESSVRVWGRKREARLQWDLRWTDLLLASSALGTQVVPMLVHRSRGLSVGFSTD